MQKDLTIIYLQTSVYVYHSRHAICDQTGNLWSLVKPKQPQIQSVQKNNDVLLFNKSVCLFPRHTRTQVKRENIYTVLWGKTF